MVGNKHIETAQRLPNDLKNNPNGLKHTQEELYRIPEELIKEMFSSIQDYMKLTLLYQYVSTYFSIYWHDARLIAITL